MATLPGSTQDCKSPFFTSISTQNIDTQLGCPQHPRQRYQPHRHQQPHLRNHRQLHHTHLGLLSSDRRRTRSTHALSIRNELRHQFARVRSEDVRELSDACAILDDAGGTGDEKVHDVVVGGLQGDGVTPNLVYIPNNITAKEGEKVIFHLWVVFSHFLYFSDNDKVLISAIFVAL